jgi:translation initiation factor IF-2
VKNEKQARDVADYREKKYRESERSFAAKMTLEDLFAKASGAGRVKELPLIIKGDVQGSVEAIISSLNKLSLLTDEVMIKILHSASGAISESDVSLAEATGAVILGFNVRTNNNASILAEKSKVDIRYYSIIYDLLNDIKMIMGGMLKPVIREEYLGSVSIRQIFNITKTGKVAGSYVTKGKIKRGAGVRLLRDNVVIHEGKLKTLRRFKEDVKEVSENFECGIAFENYENIQVGDTVEVFDLISEKRVL